MATWRKSNGRICDLGTNLQGKKAVEHLAAYEEDGKSRTIHIEFENLPFFSIRLNETSVKIKEDATSKGQTRVEMIVNSHLKTSAYLIYSILKSGLGGGVNGIFEELEYYAENDALHPPKTKTMTKTNE